MRRLPWGAGRGTLSRDRNLILLEARMSEEPVDGLSKSVAKERTRDNSWLLVFGYDPTTMWTACHPVTQKSGWVPLVPKLSYTVH